MKRFMLTVNHRSVRRRARRARAVRLRHRLRPDAIRPCHRADRKRSKSLENEATADRERNKDLYQYRQDRYDCPANLQHRTAAVQPLPPDDELAADALLALSLTTERFDADAASLQHLRQFDGLAQCLQYGTGAAASYQQATVPAHSWHGSRLRHERACWAAANRRAGRHHRHRRFGDEHQPAGSWNDPRKPGCTTDGHRQS
jgi:hypothetical protein